MNRIPAHLSVAAVIVFVVTVLITCPPDRIAPVLTWFEIVTRTAS
ncbi:hypothetical protein [Brevibacterium ammoniilyticum]